MIVYARVSDHDESDYSYHLGIAASAGARLSTPEKLLFPDKERCKIMVQSIQMDSPTRTYYLHLIYLCRKYTIFTKFYEFMP